MIPTCGSSASSSSSSASGIVVTIVSASRCEAWIGSRPSLTPASSAASAIALQPFDDRAPGRRACVVSTPSRSAGPVRQSTQSGSKRARRCMLAHIDAIALLDVSGPSMTALGRIDGTSGTQFVARKPLARKRLEVGRRRRRASSPRCRCRRSRRRRRRGGRRGSSRRRWRSPRARGDCVAATQAPYAWARGRWSLASSASAAAASSAASRRGSPSRRRGPGRDECWRRCGRGSRPASRGPASRASAARGGSGRARTSRRRCRRRPSSGWRPPCPPARGRRGRRSPPPGSRCARPAGSTMRSA